jgi:hypothetical protein
VAGAAVGIAVAEGLAVADGLAEGVALGVGDGLAEELVPGVADGLAEERDEILADADADADADAPGDSFGSVALGADPAQAAIDAEASIPAITQPAAVSLAPNPVRTVVVRIVIGPPRTPGRWRTVSRSPHRIRHRKEIAGQPSGRPRRPNGRSWKCQRP